MRDRNRQKIGKTSKNSSTGKTSNTDKTSILRQTDRQTDRQADRHFTYDYPYLNACTTATSRMITLETTLLVVLTGKMKA